MASTRTRARQLRVRHAYPDAVVELACGLARQRPVRDVAHLLDIPPSVIYRWRAVGPVSHASAPSVDAAAIEALVERCRREGIQVPRAALHGAGGADAAAATGVAASPEAASAPVERHDKRRYVFDARKERAARGVRRRLEAARREIDARYFAPLDCGALADAARMSRHHFIRVFGDLFGMSPYRYLLRVRVRAAKRLLLCSREPIDVIAAGVGFRSGPSLNRAFKQSEGASISAFCRTAPMRLSAASTA